MDLYKEHCFFLLILYVSNVCDNLTNILNHFYVDGTVVYCSSSSVVQTLHVFTCSLLLTLSGPFQPNLNSY